MFMPFDYMGEGDTAVMEPPPEIPVAGPDIPAMPEVMGPPAPQPILPDHILSIIQGGRQQDFNYTNGQIDPAQLAADQQRTRQLQQQIGQGFYGQQEPVASGPHTDKFDYAFSPQQQQRMAQLNQQKNLLWQNRNISAAQRLHAMTMLDRELNWIQRNPTATPKQQAPKFPNGRAAGEIFQDPLSGRVVVNDHSGIPKPLHDDPMSTMVSIAKELQKSDETGQDPETYTKKPFDTYLKQAMEYAKKARSIESQMGPQPQDEKSVPDQRKEVAKQQLRSINDTLKKENRKPTPLEAATILKYRATIADSTPPQ